MSRPSAGRWSSRSWSRSERGQGTADGSSHRRACAARPSAEPDLARSRPRLHARGHPLDRRDGDDGARRDHAHRPDPARPGRPYRLVARLDRPMVRDRPMAAAVPAARRRVVRRRRTGARSRIGLGDDPGRPRHRLHRRPRRVRGPQDRVVRHRARWRPHRSLPGRDPRAAAHGSGHVRAACRRRRTRTDAGLQPPAQGAHRAADGDGALGRLDDGRIDAPCGRGAAAKAPGTEQRPCRQGGGCGGRRQTAGRGPYGDARRPCCGSQHPRRTGSAPEPVASEPDGLDRAARRRFRRVAGQALAWCRRRQRQRHESRGDGPRHRHADRPAGARRRRLDPAEHRAARAARGRPRRCRRRPRVEQAPHRGEAAELLHPGQGRGGQLRAGRDPVRGPPRASRQGVPHRGPRRRPGDGPRSPLDPHRGAHPGQGRRRHRDPESTQRGRRLQATARRERDARRDEPADLRARPGRVRQGVRGRPGQDAAPAHRRRHRLGQERLRQRAHHEPAHARPARRGAAHPGRPQACRAGALQRPAAPAPTRHRRAR